MQMKTYPRIGFVACVHPIYDLPSAARYREDAISGLRAAACHVITPPTARTPADVPKIVGELRREKIDLLIFFFCTWVAEGITLEIARELADVPLLLWALPYFDLCSPMPSPMTGIIATGCNLRQAGRSFTIRIGSAIPEQIEAVAVTARTAALVTKLRQARFGLFGSACPGMLDTVCDDSLLRKQLGISTLRLDLDTLLRAHEASSAEDAFRKALELREKAGRCEVELATLAAQYRLCLGLKSLMEEYQLERIRKTECLF
jgi:L-fucose isomerase-like protein